MPRDINCTCEGNSPQYCPVHKCDPDSWTFRVKGFGEIGYANLSGFVPFRDNKYPRDLAINEMTVGTAPMCGGKDVVRLWRTR